MSQQYVLDESSNSIMKEQQETIDGKIFFLAMATFLTIIVFVVMSFLPSRHRAAAKAKKAAEIALESDVMSGTGKKMRRQAKMAKKALKTNKKKIKSAQKAFKKSAKHLYQEMS